MKIAVSVSFLMYFALFNCSLILGPNGIQHKQYTIKQIMMMKIFQFEYIYIYEYFMCKIEFYENFRQQHLI